MTPVQKIKSRYEFAKGWITIAEATPPDTNRRYDAVSISVWRSMGHQIHGFEVKTARSDWLRELADPTKADALMRYCTHWWLVCPKEVISGLDEVPETWGVLFDSGDSLRVARKAPKLDNRAPGADFWRCMLLRQATRLTTPQDITDAVDAARKTFDRNRQAEFDLVQSQLDRLRETVSKFERETGIILNNYTLDSVIRSFQRANALDLTRALDDLQRLHNSVKGSIDRLTTTEAELKQSIENLKGTNDAPSR